jgi:hypothetical protein
MNLSITKQEARKLVRALLKANPFDATIDIGDDSRDIDYIIDIELGKNRLSLTCTMPKCEWINILETIEPTSIRGEEEVRIDYDSMEMCEIMHHMRNLDWEILKHIENFEVEVINPLTIEQ